MHKYNHKAALGLHSAYMACPFIFHLRNGMNSVPVTKFQKSNKILRCWYIFPIVQYKILFLDFNSKEVMMPYLKETKVGLKQLKCGT